MAYDVIVEVNKADRIVEVEKFNPYHDSKGRFTSANSAASFTYAPGKSKAHDNAIAREKERQAAVGRGKPMTNPTGDIKADRKKEWENADYAVQFRNGGYGRVDLHDTKTDDHGNSWAEGAYGNMKIYAKGGSGSQIYLADKKSYADAIDAANKKINQNNVKDRAKAMEILESELKNRCLRTVDKDYIAQQDKARK